MEFLSLEAEEENDNFLHFSDDNFEKETDEPDDFINDKPIDEEDVRFYRERNPLDINDYPKFNGQVRNPIEAIYSDTEPYFGEDEQPELYAPEKRDEVTFDKFECFEKSVEKFKKILSNFGHQNSKESLATIYLIL